MTDGDAGARGVQVGDHNTQTNTFQVPRQPLTPAHLTELDPAVAARRLLREDVDEAAVLLATTAPGGAFALLETMLRVDEGRTLAVLTCMHPAKAKQLIDSLDGAFPWLTDLLAATAAVRRVHQDARETLGDESGTIVRIDARGFRQSCASGTIYWSPDIGAVPVREPFLTYYEAAGGPAGRLGFPLRPAHDDRQTFERDGRHEPYVVITSEHGTFATTLTVSRLKGLGVPLSEVKKLGAGWRQHFEHGNVDTNLKGEMFIVGEDFRAALNAQGLGSLLAQGARSDMHRSVHGTNGSWQRFTTSRADATVYETGKDTTAVLGFGTEAVYRSNGGPEGWLGFPLHRTSTGRHPVHFEGGVIFRHFAVPQAVFEAAKAGRIGTPTSGIEPLGTGEDTAQFFELGLVTVRGGKVQAWTST